jgi:flavin-dependent dehydrogenase
MNIKIAGAGPSGLVAAINLAKAGYKVDVYEKRTDTGKRFNGDLQGLENWSSTTNVLQELDQMNIRVNFDCDPLVTLTITNGAKQRRSHHSHNNPLCYLVKRGVLPGSLDQGLKAQALEAGVQIHFNQAISLQEADIAATGPISNEAFAVNKGIVFETTHEDINVFLINDQAAYKGYSYLLITNGYGCMCTVLFDNFAQLNDRYSVSERILKELAPFDIRNPTAVAGIGSFSTQNVFQQGKTVFVGEAAGIQDMLWGFGTRTAMQSGYLAANCLIHGTKYSEAAKKFFESKLKATLISRFLWEIVRFGNYALIMNERANNGVLSSFQLSSLYNFGPLHQLIYPFALRAMRKRYPHLKL